MGYWWVPRLVLIQSWVDDIVRSRGLSVSSSISFQTGTDCRLCGSRFDKNTRTDGITLPQIETRYYS